MAARDRIAARHPESAAADSNLNPVVEQSQDALIEMLRSRFERVVAALIETRLAAGGESQTKVDVLFALYEEGLLTKAEVRQRGGLEPDEFHDKLHAYRQRHAARDAIVQSIRKLEFSAPDDLDNDQFPFNVPTSFSEADGEAIEQILDAGAPDWVLAIRQRMDR